MDYIDVNPDGSFEERKSDVPDAFVEREIQRRIEAEIERRLGDSISDGANWLRSYRAKHRDYIEEVPLGDETWYIKRLSCGDLDTCGVLQASLGQGVVHIADLTSKAIFSKALLHVGVVCGPNDPTRKFATFEEAAIFYEEGRGNAGAICKAVRDELLWLNPCFVGEEGEGADKKKRILTPEDFG